jgi:hypothetical protein
MSNPIHFDDPKNVRLMLKLGIIGPDTDEADVFLRWGVLIGDPVIFERRPVPGYISASDMHEVIAGMSATERLELRDRVCGVLQIS